MKKHIFIITLIIIDATYVLGFCKIDKEGLKDSNYPLILKPDKLEFLYPEKETAKFYEFSIESRLRLACPGSNLIIRLGKNNHRLSQLEYLECQSNGKFVFDGVEVTNFACDEKPKITVETGGRTCANSRGQLWKIGFGFNKFNQFDKHHVFIPTLELCYKNEDSSTYWSHSVIQPKKRNVLCQSFLSASNFARARVPTSISNWRAELMYDTDPNDAYKRLKQVETFQKLKIKNLDTYVRGGVDIKGQEYLAKGHLVAYEDMFYEIQKKTTNFYINAAPMWQYINNGNWGYLEDIIRTFSSEHQLELDVWTGGLGVLSLPAIDNGEEKDKKIYLSSQNSGSYIPVPKVLFKIIFSKKERAGMVIVTVNNPETTKGEISENYRLCSLVTNCDRKIDAATQNFKHSYYKRGYTYCCQLDRFLKENFVSWESDFPEIGSFKDLKYLKISYDRIPEECAKHDENKYNDPEDFQ